MSHAQSIPVLSQGTDGKGLTLACCEISIFLMVFRSEEPYRVPYFPVTPTFAVRLAYEQLSICTRYSRRGTDHGEEVSEGQRQAQRRGRRDKAFGVFGGGEAKVGFP